MSKNKKHKISNLTDAKQTREYIEAMGNYGTVGNRIPEPIPKLNLTPIEKVYNNKNSWIVLGGDRNASPLSGYAGAGFTQSSAIDMCVGRKSGEDGQPPGDDKTVDPDTYNDAARIYITQRGNADNYFGIAEGKYTDGQSDTNTKSAVVAKADHVRLFGREGIKIVTGRSKNSGGQKEKNSNGKNYDRNGTIELIAGNYTTTGLLSRREILQPVIKGDNLVEMLNELIDVISELNSLSNIHSNSIMALAGMLGGLGAPYLTAPCAAIGYAEFINTVSSAAITVNLGGMQKNFLKPTGQVYINSTHVFAT